MTEDTADGIRERIQRTSEDALGKVAQELLENPLVSGAISRAFEAREKAGQAQEVAMGALNLWVAFSFSTEVWVSYKLFGGIGLLLLFSFAQALYLARFIKDDDATAEKKS